MCLRRRRIGRAGGLHFPVMFLGLGRRGRSVAGRVAMRISGRVGGRRIGLNLSTVVAGFSLSSCAGVGGGLLGFLGEHGGSCQQCNENKFFHRVLIFLARTCENPGSST
jgi:hypothetical protein